MKHWKIFMAAAALLLSCDSDFEYSDYHCNFYMDNGTHLNLVLASAMNSNIPGTFCTISYKYSSAYYYYCENNLGDKNTDPDWFTAIDKNRSNHLRIGMNNGLIVGFGNLSSPAVFYAYDNECPNCFDYNALPVKSYKLSVNSAGIATCSNCKRTYNLNTGGNCTNGSGHMTCYRASTTGPTGILNVN